MPELIKNGESGYIVPKDDVQKMAEMVKEIGEIDRAFCRKWVQDNFSIEAMADSYLKAYQIAIKAKERKA